MAQTLKLKRVTYYPSSGTTETLDLLTGVLRVAVDGWSLNYASGEGDPIWDSFELVGRGTTDPALGTAVYNVQDFITDARRSANNTNRDEQFWLHYQPDNGTEVRTLITDASFAIQSDPGKGGLGPLMNNDGYIRATLAVQHMPAWEGVALIQPETSNMNVCGSIAWGTAITSGDLDGRIVSANVFGMANSTYIDDMWIGIRPYYNGTASFKSWWQCEDGTALATGGASVVADGAASGGTAVRVDFSGTSSMIQRMRIGITDVIAGGGSVEHYAGKYLVLGRVKCGTSTECLIDLYQGLRQVNYAGSPQGIEMVGETKVSNNLYKLVELGQVQFPPFGMRVLENVGSNVIGHSTMYVFAERLSGTSYLYLDALCLVPCEHLLVFKNAGAGTNVDYLSYQSNPYGDEIAYVNRLATPIGIEVVEHSVNDFKFPADGGLIVTASQQAAATAAHDLSINADIQFSVYPRYSLMRLT